ncbi:MAG: alpha/beta hydrolase [Pseudobdellovibrionaceae bacterium]
MDDPLNLAKNKIPIRRLQELKTFRTRSGIELSYRHYPAWSESVIFLFHGIGSDSKYLCALAQKLCEDLQVHVVTPDFRGHGVSLGVADPKPMDLQLDLEELIVHLKMHFSLQNIFLAGHSLGGGFVLRIASSSQAGNYKGFLALSPYLPPDFQVHHSDYGGWISIFSEQKKVIVNMADFFKTGSEKLDYSFDYMQAVQPSLDLLDQLKKKSSVVLLLSGEKDQVFQSYKYTPLFADLIKTVSVSVHAESDHMSIVMNKQALEKIILEFKNKFERLF